MRNDHRLDPNRATLFGETTERSDSSSYNTMKETLRTLTARGCLGEIFLLWLTLGSSAEAGDIPDGRKELFVSNFNSEICGKDAPNVRYIALGISVLALPPGWWVGSLLERERSPGLQPPDPAQPSGCVGNPAQLASYNSVYWANRPPGEHTARSLPGEDGVVRFSLIALQSGPGTSRVEEAEWGPEHSAVLWSTETCRLDKVTQKIGSPFTFCRRPVGYRPIAIIVAPEIYRTPSGSLFSMNCESLDSFPSNGWCTVTYAFSSSIGITYDFEPSRVSQPTSQARAADEILEFDRALRTQIYVMTVRQYKWPNI